MCTQWPYTSRTPSLWRHNDWRFSTSWRSELAGFQCQPSNKPVAVKCSSRTVRYHVMLCTTVYNKVTSLHTISSPPSGRWRRHPHGHVLPQPSIHLSLSSLWHHHCTMSVCWNNHFKLQYRKLVAFNKPRSRRLETKSMTNRSFRVTIGSSLFRADCSC